jgi:hypothetical protein
MGSSWVFPEVRIGDGTQPLCQLSYRPYGRTGLEPATSLLTGEGTVACAPGKCEVVDLSRSGRHRIGFLDKEVAGACAPGGVEIVAFRR